MRYSIRQATFHGGPWDGEIRTVELFDLLKTLVPVTYTHTFAMTGPGRVLLPPVAHLEEVVYRLRVLEGAPMAERYHYFSEEGRTSNL